MPGGKRLRKCWKPLPPGDTEKYHRGLIMFHPRKTTPSIQSKLQPGNTKKSREGNASENVGNPSVARIQKISRGGMKMFHPRKNALHTIETPTRGHEKNSREGKASESVFPGDPLRRSRGPEQAVPGMAPFDAPRSPSLALGPVLSPMTPRLSLIHI